MRQKLALFKLYISKLAKNWILWIFLAFDSLAIIIQLLVPSLRMPQVVYLSLALIGVVWAGFETYLELLKKIPSEELPLDPEVELHLVEGNEYSYRFEDLSERYSEEAVRKMSDGEHADSRFLTSLPKSQAVIHLRVENSGRIPFDLLTVSGEIDLTSPFSFMVPHPIDVDGQPLKFPIRLEHDEFFIHDLITPIHPYSLLTDAQIAARTRELLLDNEPSKISIYVEVSDTQGTIKKFQLNDTISLKPLCDLYVAHWRDMGRTDLLRLAGYSLAAKDERSKDDESGDHANSANQ